MSRYEEIAHEVAAEGTEAAWAARDAILELVAEVATLRELVDEQGKNREVLERSAQLREEIISKNGQLIDELMKGQSKRAEIIQEQREAIAKQAELIKSQHETIGRLMGKGVFHA